VSNLTVRVEASYRLRTGQPLLATEEELQALTHLEMTMEGLLEVDGAAAHDVSVDGIVSDWQITVMSVRLPLSKSLRGLSSDHTPSVAC
jgi:hypothetical protein